MANIFTHVHIHRFRSILECRLDDLRQINVFIGRPNTGKTNLIDALSLFSIPELPGYDNLGLNDLIRVQEHNELFFVKNTTQYASVTSNRGNCMLRYQPSSGGLDARFGFDTSSGAFDYFIDHDFRVHSRTTSEFQPLVRRYKYDSRTVYRPDFRDDLATPGGYNLFDLIGGRSDVQDALTTLLSSTGIQLVGSSKIRTDRPGSDKLMAMSFSSQGDTVKQLMFYLAAIASNKGKVLVLDNLDANVFPNHLMLLATAMVHNPQNQYFLSTHDPFLLLDLLDEDSWDHLAVYNVYTKNYETNIYRLTEADLHEVFYNGVDAFTNNEHFVP